MFSCIKEIQFYFCRIWSSDSTSGDIKFMLLLGMVFGQTATTCYPANPVYAHRKFNPTLAYERAAYISTNIFILIIRE